LGKSDVEGYFEGPYYEWFRFNKVVFSDSCWLKWHRDRDRERLFFGQGLSRVLLAEMALRERERERDYFVAEI
jgi:hypothetical protein